MQCVYAVCKYVHAVCIAAFTAGAFSAAHAAVDLAAVD